MKRIVVLILLALSSISFGTYIATNFTDLVLEKLEFYENTDFPEKVYVHTDKSVYSLSETIWFTGYLVNGISHLKSSKSYVMYVELINEKDSIVDRKKLYVENISEAGDFKISKNWNSGKYVLRAYTNEMRNNSSDYFFEKDIWIWSSDKKAEVAENTSSNSEENTESLRPSLNFYPEGGYLIEGVNNKIAIKLKSENFETSDIAGFIYDNEGNKVSKFNIYKFGLGLVILNPEKGKTYYASLNINGNEEHYPLPKIEQKGFAINAVNNGENIVVNVLSSFELGLKGTFLVAHQRGRMVFQKYEEEIKSKYSVGIQTKHLDDGVVHLTLFDASGNPVSERLLFVQNPENKINFSIEKNRTGISNRQKLTLKLNVKDYLGNKTSGNFSMAVRDVKVSPKNSHGETIKTWLLLNSDLRGEVENPSYFFEDGDVIKKRFLLDLVMLTNGWRRFSWNKFLYEQRGNKQFEIEQGIFISGKTKNLRSPFEPYSAATRFTLVNKQPYQETQQSDENGDFKYGPFVFFDSIPTLIEARKTNFSSEKGRDKKLLILIDKEKEYPGVSKRNKSMERKKSLIGVTNYLQQIRLEYGTDVRELDEVLITAKKESEQQKRNEEMNERTMYGEPSDRVITEGESGVEWKTVLELLRGKAGLRVDGNSVSIRGGGSPAFYLDGMEIDSTFIETIHASEIEFIDILKGPDANIFSNSGNGVIALYSRVGTNISSSFVKRSPGIIDFSSKGFYVAKEFYAPDHIHGIEEQVNPDFRTTLHWEPDIRLTTNNTMELSFFTSDLKGDYMIEIEGITDTGIPVHAFSTFEVN